MATDPGDGRSIGLTLAAEILDSARFVLNDVDVYGRGYVVLVRDPNGRISSGIADANSIVDRSDEYPSGQELRIEIDVLRHYAAQVEREVPNGAQTRAWWPIHRLREIATEIETEAIARGDLPAPAWKPEADG